MENEDRDWQTSAQAYLKRLGEAEYRAAFKKHCKKYAPSTYRHNPSEYHRRLVEFLGQNDEEGFKALKGLQGYASAVGT